MISCPPGLFPPKRHPMALPFIAGPDRHPHFLAAKFREKYAQSLGTLSFEQWRSTFSQPLLVHVERIIAWTRTAAGVAYRVVP